MHTLILAEHEASIRRMLRDPASQIRLPQGIDRTRYVLQIWDEGSPEADMVAGPNSKLGTVALASADRTKRRIYEFADHCLATDRLTDVVTIQVLFLFHRSHRKNVRALVKAIRLLDGDDRWRKLPEQHLRALRAARIVLLSCESGIEMNPADVAAYPSFFRQSHDLRIASAVTFRLEQKPPPARPPAFWAPFIYTFTIGSFIEGGTVLHPNQVSFVHFTNQSVQGQGDDEHVDTIPGQNYVQSVSAGRIHKYEGANYVGSLDVPAGTSVDMVNPAF